MTLLIAGLLIYHADLSGWWYAIAFVVWIGKMFALDRILKSNVDAIISAVRNAVVREV